MIPAFPGFKKLQIDDKKEIETINSKFPPYSDFNFTSLWSWNTQDLTEISLLDNNLIIKLQDYITKKTFYTFLGLHNAALTAQKIIDLANLTHTDKTLHLIPEEIINKTVFPENFVIEEDRDNFDYILSVQDNITLQGKKFRGKKNFTNRFNKLYEGQARNVHLNINDKNIQKEIINLFLIWEKNTKKSRSETQNELTAVQRILQNADKLNIFGIGIRIDNLLAAFSINEITHKEYGIIHFEKADTSFQGIFQYLRQQTAVNFNKQNCIYINYEQDLGIEGLRKAKLAGNPEHFLKKYNITAK